METIFFSFSEMVAVFFADETSHSLMCEEEIVVQAEQSKHTLNAINEQLCSLPVAEDDLETAEQSVDDLLRSLQLVDETVESQKTKMNQNPSRFKNPNVLKSHEDLKSKQNEIRAILNEKATVVNKEKGTIKCFFLIKRR